jgi:hypothetical protein
LDLSGIARFGSTRLIGILMMRLLLGMQDLRSETRPRMTPGGEEENAVRQDAGHQCREHQAQNGLSSAHDGCILEIRF